MMMFKAFAKKLFGVRYERIIKTVIICAIIFMGIASSGYKLPIAPQVLFLMSAVVTAAMMWQALSSGDTAAYIRNMVMMPFENRIFSASFIGTLCIYVLITKTLPLWALVFAVGQFGLAETVCAVLAALCAAAIAACAFAYRKGLIVCLFWAALLIGSIFLCGSVNVLIMTGIFAVNILLAVFILGRTDGYSFYDASCATGTKKSTAKSRRGGLVFTYLMRYLLSHKNYIVNTVFMWGLAVILPVFVTLSLGTEDPVLVKMFMFMGYGFVAMNTPLCILVSCDPDLERGIRCLPGGVRSFFVPYGLFLFLSNCVTYVFFLVSWKVVLGGVGMLQIICAVVFALLSAGLSVAAELFFPLRNWKIESDLWHHPRKYVVPGIIILLAGLVGSLV